VEDIKRLVPDRFGIAHLTVEICQKGDARARAGAPGVVQ